MRVMPKVTIRPRPDGVDMRVEGHLDDCASRALLDAVEAAVAERDSVVIVLDARQPFSGEAIRNLAACAARGALLRFNPPDSDR
jgi:hypothetical protein